MIRDRAELHDWEGMSVKDLVRANKACANNPVQPTADGHDSIAIKDQMSMCGFVVLRDLFPEDMIAEVEKVVSRQFQHAARSSHVHRDTAGFVKRGSKRFEMGLEAILEQFVKRKSGLVKSVFTSKTKAELISATSVRGPLLRTAVTYLGTPNFTKT